MTIHTFLVRRKQRFKKALIRRFVVRFHMSLIIGGCFLGGVIANKLLMLMNVAALPIRYVLAILAAYLVFFMLVRLWLLYVSRQRGNLDFNIDLLDLPIPRLPKADSRSHSTEAFGGQGGDFSGAGASGSWRGGSANGLPSTLSIERQPVAVDAVPKGSHGGCDVSLDCDEGPAIIIIVALAALIAAIFGAGLYLIFEAPAILTDAAFEMALSAGLVKSLKRMDRPNWIGNVFLNTWKPFAVTVCLALLFGVLAQHYCPGAHMLKELYDACL